MPKTPEGLFMPHASLLPGTVPGPADPHSWAQPFCASLWTYSGIWMCPLGLQPSSFPSNHCSCWRLAPSQPIPCLLCHLPRCCISCGTAASSLQGHPQTLDVPPVPQAITEVSPTGHWVGQHVSHTVPSGDPAVPVWVVGTPQSKYKKVWYKYNTQ